MAVKTVANGGGNFSAGGTWVGGVAPIAGDSVAFTATSGQLTVDTSTVNLAGIDFTNYVNTITFNNPINISSGTINFGTGGYTQAGTNGLVITASVTITPGGVTWLRTMTFTIAASSTITLSSNLNIPNTVIINISTANAILSFSGSGQFLPNASLSVNNTTGGAGSNVTVTVPNNLTISSLTITGSAAGSSNNVILNGNTINITGNLSIGSTNQCTCQGTTNIVIIGTGSWTIGAGVCILQNNLTINTGGIITIPGNVYYNTGTFTYLSGTVRATTGILNIVNADCTLINMNKIPFGQVIIGASRTVTMNQFFSGLPTAKTLISCVAPSSTYTVTFQDGFEKIAQHVKVSGCVLSRPLQLLIVTKNTTITSQYNTGIRYTNQLPNGIAKNIRTGFGWPKYVGDYIYPDPVNT